MTDVADTGESVKVRFYDAVRLHYAEMDRLVFSKYYSDRITEGGNSWGFNGNLPGTETPDPQDYPRFTLTFPRMSETLAAGLPDFGLLLVYLSVLFTAAAAAFLRYDVR